MNLANIQLDKQKKILIVIICIIIFYLDSNFILKAHLAGLKNLDVKIVKLESDLTNLGRDLANMRASKGKQGLGTQKEVIKSTEIISEGQISGLLHDISSEANKFDIKIVQIRPSRQDQNAKSSMLGSKFTALLINLELICDYHNLGKFINTLENSLIYMGVGALKISTQLPYYMKQRVSLVLETYVTR